MHSSITKGPEAVMHTYLFFSILFHLSQFNFLCPTNQKDFVLCQCLTPFTFD